MISTRRCSWATASPSWTAGVCCNTRPPLQIIRDPATPFVAALIGAGDRALRLLSLVRVETLVEPGPAEGAPVAAGLSLRGALSECLWSGRSALPVAAADGRILGRVTRAAIEQAGADPG